MNRKQFLTYFSLGALLIIVYVALSNYQGSLPAVLGFITSTFGSLCLGACLAFVINIPTRFYERLVRRSGASWAVKRARGIALLLALLSFALAIVLILIFIVPSLMDAGSALVTSIQNLATGLRNGTLLEGADALSDFLSDILSEFGSSLEDLFNRIVAYLKDNSRDLLTGTISAITSTVSGVVTFFIALVFAIYFVSSKEILSRHIKKLSSLVLAEKRTARACHVASVAFESFRKFAVAQVMEAIIMGILCFVCMLLFRFPEPAMISVVVGVSALVPVYGAFFGAFFGAVVILVQSPLQALAFLVFLIILQQLEGNLIYPRVVGGSVGLPSIYTFTLVSVAGAAFGLVGMLFAVPLGSVAYILVKEASARKAANRAIATRMSSADKASDVILRVTARGSGEMADDF